MTQDECPVFILRTKKGAGTTASHPKHEIQCMKTFYFVSILLVHYIKLVCIKRSADMKP